MDASPSETVWNAQVRCDVGYSRLVYNYLLSGEQAADNGQPAGLLETFEAVRYIRGLFSNIAVSAAYCNPAARPDQELQPLIFHALAAIIPRHPALGTVFFDAEEKSKPYYARLPRIDLRECVVFVPKHRKSEETSGIRDPQWDRVLEEHHNTRFDERWGELPLWRLVVLHDPIDNSRFTACFVYQHTVGDGNAGLSFHRALLAELSSVSRAGHHTAPDPVVLCTDASTSQSLESLHPLPLSPGYLLKMAWADKFPSNSEKLWLGGPVSKPTRSRFRSCVIDAKTTEKLLAVSRAHSVTLTATCHALVGHAIFANLPPVTSQLKTSIAVNLRRFLPADVVEQDVMGNYVSAPVLDLRRPASTSEVCWADAQRIKKFLDGEVGRNGKDTSTACLRWAGNIHNYFESKFGKARDGSFQLTNLGVFTRRASDTGPWRTGRMVFSEGFDCSREAICVTMVTGEDGCLTVGLVWGDGVVEEQLMLNIYETLASLLINTATA